MLCKTPGHRRKIRQTKTEKDISGNHASDRGAARHVKQQKATRAHARTQTILKRLVQEHGAVKQGLLSEEHNHFTNNQS